MIRRQIARKGDDVFPLFVSAVRIDFLRGAGLAGDRETRHRRRRRRASIAHHSAQRIPDLLRRLRRNYLAQHNRRKCAHRFAILARDRFHDPRRDELAAIRDRRHRHRHLQRGDADFVAHRNARNGNLAPRLRRANHTADFSRQFDASALAETEAPDVFVKFLFAHGDGQLRRADVARFHQDVLHGQLAVGLVIVQRAPAEIPNPILAKDRRVGPDLVLVQRRRRAHDFESGARFHHVDDGAVLHLFGFRVRALVEIEGRPVRHRQNLAGLRAHENDRRFLRRVFAHGRVDFVLDDVLQIQIDGEVDLVTVARRPFLPAIKHHLLPGAVMLDEAVTILAVEIFFHGRFDSLDPAMLEIGEADDVAKHRAVRINPGRIALEINAAQILRPQFFPERCRQCHRHFAFQHDIAPIAFQFLR